MSDIGRVPPQNVEAERWVIGACLTDPEAYDKVKTLLKADHFYVERHQIIWRAIVHLRESGRPSDLVTVTALLKEQNQLEQAGGYTYLAQVTAQTITTANVEAHAEIVAEKAAIRQSIQNLSRVIDLLYGPGEVDLQEAAFLASIAVVDGPSRLEGLETLGAVARRRVEEMRLRRPGEVPGATTGYRNLDLILGGMAPGDLIVVGARPSMGKTGLVAEMTHRSAWATGLPWLVVTKDMGVEAYADRAIVSGAMIEPMRWRTNRLSDRDWRAIEDWVKHLEENVPVYLDDKSRTVADIQRAAQAIKRAHGKIGGITIDYLQLLSGARRRDGRTVEVSEIARELKDLALALNCPIIAVSQLSRMVEMRQNKRPTLADLRESGEIEAAADKVLLLYRDDYYAEREGRESEAPGLVEVIIAKHRNGPVGQVTLRFLPQWVRFEELERRQDEELQKGA